MKDDTKAIKQTNKIFQSLTGEDAALGSIAMLMEKSKIHFNDLLGQMKLILVEFLLAAEREKLSGPEYCPEPGWGKWGWQTGSVYAGGEKLKVKKPRLRKNGKEMPLSIYNNLKDQKTFSEEVLKRVLLGVSTRQYPQALSGLLEQFGLSKSAVSRRLVAATTAELKKLKERSLEDFEPFALVLDGYHLAGEVFVVALGIDIEGKKKVLGFWQGATENHVVCQELLSDLERRGLELDDLIIFITDGGKGIIKALKEKIGQSLLHQRCILHKNRNIQRHLPKKYREMASLRFKRAFDCTRYADADEELKSLEKWLEEINPSAAESLREGRKEL